MRELINLFENAAIETDRQYWYRGVGENAIRSSQLNGRVRDASELPPEVRSEIEPVADEIYRVGWNYNFKISRTYNGMANWGFGVYVTTSVDWARRYGDTIIVSKVDPADILTITDRNFADAAPGTFGGRLYELLDAGETTMGEQAAVMFRAVKKIKKTAKALFVQTDNNGGGQMCVFNAQYITPKFVFNVKK